MRDVTNFWRSTLSRSLSLKATTTTTEEEDEKDEDEDKEEEEKDMSLLESNNNTLDFFDFFLLRTDSTDTVAIELLLL